MSEFAKYLQLLAFFGENSANFDEISAKKVDPLQRRSANCGL